MSIHLHRADRTSYVSLDSVFDVERVSVGRVGLTLHGEEATAGEREREKANTMVGDTHQLFSAPTRPQLGLRRYGAAHCLETILWYSYLHLEYTTSSTSVLLLGPFRLVSRRSKTTAGTWRSTTMFSTTFWKKYSRGPRETAAGTATQRQPLQGSAARSGTTPAVAAHHQTH